MTLRAVVDPNVFISAQISSLGHPALIARAAEAGAFELVVSERLLAELRDVLVRPRFRRYMPEDEVEELIADLRAVGTVVAEGEIGRIVPEDPKDDYLVAPATVRAPPKLGARRRVLPSGLGEAIGPRRNRSVAPMLAAL